MESVKQMPLITVRTSNSQSLPKLCYLLSYSLWLLCDRFESTDIARLVEVGLTITIIVGNYTDPIKLN